mmetsp:Transcript_23658/g.56026  ORF Transcript_23658/g.56026 Transcript_23658/m.56026 type:complete len:288 (-) Transcript_23658:1437-2300(-)
MVTIGSLREPDVSRVGPVRPKGLHVQPISVCINLGLPGGTVPGQVPGGTSDLHRIKMRRLIPVRPDQQHPVVGRLHLEAVRLGDTPDGQSVVLVELEQARGCRGSRAVHTGVGGGCWDGELGVVTAEVDSQVQLGAGILVHPAVREGLRIFGRDRAVVGNAPTVGRTSVQGGRSVLTSFLELDIDIGSVGRLGGPGSAQVVRTRVDAVGVSDPFHRAVQGRVAYHDRTPTVSRVVANDSQFVRSTFFHFVRHEESVGLFVVRTLDTVHGASVESLPNQGPVSSAVFR